MSTPSNLPRLLSSGELDELETRVEAYLEIAAELGVERTIIGRVGPGLLMSDIASLLSTARAHTANPPTGGQGYDWTDAEDDISDAINDSMDMDWTSSIGARAVVAYLKKIGAVLP